MIPNIRILDLLSVLGSEANADELERLLRLIKRANFVTLPNNWGRWVDGRVWRLIGVVVELIICSLTRRTNVRCSLMMRSMSSVFRIHVYRPAILSSGTTKRFPLSSVSLMGRSVSVSECTIS